MVHRKRIGINLVALITAIGLTATLFGEPVLVSIKKGTEGNKSWAVFSFEGDVEWSGVSQSSDGKLSLYFKGGSGDLNGSSVILDARQDNRVYVKQLSQTPPIFRADIIFNVNQPIVILRKENHMIVAFNDERLVSTNAQLSSEDVTFTSTLYQVKPEWLAEYMKISFNFDSDFQWAGYVRHSSDHVDLIFMGAEHNLSEESLTFSKGPLHTVQLYHSTDPVVKLKASLWFKGVSNFSIAKKGNQILTQAYYPETELIASTKSVPSNINPKAREPEPLFTDAELDKAKTNETKYDTQDMDALLNLPSASAVTPAAEPLVTTQSADKTQNTQDESFAGSTMQMVDEIEKQKDGVLWDTPVSFEFRSTPIKDALRLVAKTNDLNMVIGDEVDGSVTMTLSEVTLRQALEKIVVTNGFEYIVDDNIIIVKTVRAKYAGGRVTKVYRLKYADAANVASVIKNIVTSDSLVQVFYPEFLQFIDDQQSQGGGGGGGQRYPGAGMSRMQASPQSIQGIRRASILVVTERPDMIREIDDLVRELDAPSTQIVIEARFYELNPENTNQMGINWQETWNVFNYMPNDLGILPGFSIESEQAAIAQWDWRSGHLNPLQYQAVLQFLSEQKESKIISHPKLLAMENEEASISIGTSVPLPSISQRTNQPDLVTYTFKEINIQLNVVPHVGDNDEITMYVNPVVEQIVDWVETGNFRIPITGKRSVNSIVTVKNGETVVIGGLIKSQEIKSVKRVPFFGSLPLIGKLFQQNIEESVQTDLVIFITPTIQL